MSTSVAAPTLTARIFGVRGSVPVTRPEFLRFGGNTPCVAVEADTGARIILDAGTGIRTLGRELDATQEPLSADVFLTHFHWDHIQGLPFFAPLTRPETTLRIHAPRQGTLDAGLLLGMMASPVYFPLPLRKLGAHIEYVDALDNGWTGDGVRVDSMRVHHPSHTRGYRITAGGASLAYVPDNEIEGDAPDDGLLQFLRGADVLIHDAMYTVAEYEQRRGWGHSAVERVVDLASRAEVRLLCLFHHDPDRSDDALDELAAMARAGAAGSLRVEAAAEGDVITIPAGRPPLLCRQPHDPHQLSVPALRP